MKAISSAIVFLGCMVALVGIAIEETRLGRYMIWPSCVIGTLSFGALVTWWREVRKP